MVEFTARDRLKLLAGAGASLLSACGGGGNVTTSSPAANTPPPPSVPLPPPPPVTSGATLSETFENNFTVGVALSSPQSDELDGQSRRIALEQFNGVTPEFEMQPSFLSPEEGVFNFDRADRLVDFAMENNMPVRGHSLLWHEQTPDYMVVGTRNEIRQRLDTYIGTVVEHFKDRISIWDVVNEATSPDIFNGPDSVGPDRVNSVWYQAVGNADYIDWAFIAARAADTNAQLFLNDFETEDPIKLGFFIDIIRRLHDRGVPIDGAGHQTHLRLQNPNPDVTPQTIIASVLNSIDAVQTAFPGLTTHITEFDINMYTDPGSCFQAIPTGCQPDIGLNAPQELLQQQAEIYRGVFQGLIQRPFVEYVSFWGVTDGDSFANLSPVERFNHPLLFDRSGEPKSAFNAIIDPNFVI
ncbi:MAG: endo-1,4-beta-xylanase [Maricaulaceae bacterium]